MSEYGATEWYKCGNPACRMEYDGKKLAECPLCHTPKGWQRPTQYVPAPQPQGPHARGSRESRGHASWAGDAERWNQRARRWAKALYYIGAVIWWVMVAAAVLVVLLGVISSLVGRDGAVSVGIAYSGMWGPMLASVVVAVVFVANGVVLGAPLKAVGAYLARKSYSDVGS